MRSNSTGSVPHRLKTGDTIVYQLVMPEDADVEQGLISTASPIGRALLNREEGDEVVYPNPGFPIYESMINFLGATPVPMPLVESRGIHPATLADRRDPFPRLPYLNASQLVPDS